jgi:hypothetical protein
VRAEFGGFVLDTRTRQLLRGREPVRLTPKAFDVLVCLVEARPRALSKSELLERVWPSTFVSEANLASLVKELRRALDDTAEAPRFLRTVRGFGYAFASAEGEGAFPAEDAGFRLYWERREAVLGPGENLLGRTRQAQVCVDHGSVSRRHALIRVAGAVATIEDCGSKNGTFLCGRRVAAPEPLADGDEIRLGEARLVFRAHAGEPPTATATGRD